MCCVCRNKNNKKTPNETNQAKASVVVMQHSAVAWLVHCSLLSAKALLGGLQTLFCGLKVFKNEEEKTNAKRHKNAMQKKQTQKKNEQPKRKNGKK